MGKQAYMPAIGTEGADFFSKWCANCKRDAGFQDDMGDGCPILADSYCGKQPAEWRVWRGEAVCDAFDGETYPQLAGFAVRDLFPNAPRRPSQGAQIRALVPDLP